MRGFPLLRSLVILIWLTVSAAALVKLTGRTGPPKEPGPKEFKAVEATGEKVAIAGYSISVSAEMAGLVINGVQEPLPDSPVSSSLSGRLAPTDQPEVVTLVIRWKNPPSAAERRFARLTVYPPGKPTVSHVFEAAGDIDDILELP